MSATSDIIATIKAHDGKTVSLPPSLVKALKGLDVASITTAAHKQCPLEDKAKGINGVSRYAGKGRKALLAAVLASLSDKDRATVASLELPQACQFIVDALATVNGLANPDTLTSEGITLAQVRGASAELMEAGTAPSMPRPSMLALPKPAKGKATAAQTKGKASKGSAKGAGKASKATKATSKGKASKGASKPQAEPAAAPLALVEE